MSCRTLPSAICFSPGSCCGFRPRTCSSGASARMAGRIPGMPDVNYLRATSQQLQQFFNHPLIRRTGGTTAEEALSATELHPEEILEMKVIRHPKDKVVFWLECVTVRGGRFQWRALTHHNVAELQRSGVFLPHLDVTLSLDNRTLSLLNTRSHQEETIAMDHGRSDAELAQASHRLRDESTSQGSRPPRRLQPRLRRLQTRLKSAPRPMRPRCRVVPKSPRHRLRVGQSSILASSRSSARLVLCA
jgi:hypothetical protein